ncbi:MAG: tetratricopeptide repeat protein, partial [Planctomycetota bacterium]
MASRVNTRFLLILAVALMAGGGIVGGLWFLQMRADATRNIRAGDEFMAQGDFEKAWQHYGRAVSKQPANLEYVDMLHEALLRITPQTSGEAAELYMAHIETLGHRVRYYPLDAEAHLDLLEELHRFARFIGGQTRWRRLADAADDMWQRVPPSDARRAYALLYRGLAHRSLSTVLTDDEVLDAEKDLRAFLEAVPDSDLGWATLAALQSDVADRFQIKGETRRAAEKSDEFEETLKAAVEGPEVAMIALMDLMRRRSQDAQAVSDDELRSAADHLADLAERSGDAFVVAEAALLLSRLVWLGGHSQAIDLLETYLDDHPDAHRHRQVLAGLQEEAEDLEAAADSANVVLGAELLPVGLLSNYQRTLKVNAASLLLDIEFARWERAETVDKAARLPAVKAAVERLAAVVSDPDQSPALARAQGKLAFANGQYDAAAAKFEGLIRARVGDVDVYHYSALALEELGQLGRALERVEQVVRSAPRNLRPVVDKARLQYKLGSFADAAETIKIVVDIDPENEMIQRLATAIQVGLSSSGAASEADPVARALGDAQVARVDGDLETARLTLLAALDEQPRNLIVLSELVRVEIESGLREDAQGHLDRALELSPTNDQLNRLQAALKHDDIVLAVREYVEAVYIDEEERAVNFVANLSVHARQLEEAAGRAEVTGRTDVAVKLREQATRARQAEETALTEARRVAPDHPRLLEYEFAQAVRAQDRVTLERLVQKAKNLNADQAGGYLFEGRYHLTRGDLREAVRTLTETTNRKPYSSIAWRLLGTSYRSLGNMGEAIRAYEQAYRCNPKDLAGVRDYVWTLLQTGENLRALEIVRAAHKLAPQDIPLREQWLDLEAEVGDAALAINTRRAMFVRDPEDRLNASNLVSVLVAVEPSRELILDETGNEMYPETKWRRMSTLERKRVLAAAREAFRREADDILNRVAAVHGEDLDLAVQRAQLLRGRGQVE